MHLTLVAIGSRGDVQPFIALGLGLKNTGYQVRIAAFQVFADFVDGHGLEFAPITGDPRESMESQFGQAWLDSGTNVLSFVRNFRRITDQNIEQSLVDMVDACRGTQAIIYSMLGGAGYHVAEMLSVPSIFALLQPFSRTRAFPSIVMPNLPWGGGYNWFTHIVSEQLLWHFARRPINRWRQETLNLKPLPFSGPFNKLYQKRKPYLYGLSEYVVPPPPDLPEWHHVTGYWFLDNAQNWSPPAGLKAFITSGPKPVYIGFGSMSGPAAQNLANIAIEAMKLTKLRAVLVGGWAGVHTHNHPPDIYPLSSAPHDWLFPKMAAVVHHGGAGTTAAGLKASVPSVIIPFFADQPFWGRRVHTLGVGPEPIQRKALTAKRLADALNQAVTDQKMQRRAASLGQKIQSEDGISKAVAIVNDYLN